MSVIEVYPLYTKVNFNDVEATINGINIEIGPHIMYRLIWYSNGARNASWVENFEFERIEEKVTEETKKLLVAFK